MSYDETFKFVSRVDEGEVFALTGSLQSVRELQPSGFDGPVAEWAELRSKKFGDDVIPRHVYIGNSNGELHRVAWVYHSGMDFESGDNENHHHIVCDCALELEQTGGDPYKMFGCPSLLNMLNIRAQLISSQLHYEEIRDNFFDGSGDDLSQSSVLHDLNVRTIAYILEHDARHPESWMGNIISDQHTASLLSLIIQTEPPTTRWYAELLEQSGHVEFDGETLRLVAEDDDFSQAS